MSSPFLHSQRQRFLSSISQLILLPLIISQFLSLQSSSFNSPILILRIVSHLQFNDSNPRQNHPEKSLSFVVGGCIFLNVLVLGGHAISGLQGEGRGGMMVDFIGQISTTSHLKVFLQDLLILSIQLISLILSWDLTSSNLLPLEDSDSPSLEELKDPFEIPLFTFEFKSNFKRIRYSKNVGVDKVDTIGRGRGVEDEELQLQRLEEGDGLG